MNLFELFVKIGVDDQASGKLKSLSSELGSGLKTAAKVGTAAISAFGGGLAAIATYAAKVGGEFEAQMSKVSAISGATGDDLQALEDKAKQLGIDTKFSATEAGQAFEYMAMAGWKTEQMLDGVSGIMDLAAASGEDLASVSDIVTDAMTAFGLSADQSTHFADVLAKASSNANTNVGLMGETFKYVAPVAGAMGFSVEDTATAIGLMANAGIKGSQAGTALRSMFSRLAKPTDEVESAMKKLNLSITNSDGSMKELDEIMADLRKGFDGLTESEKTQIAAQLAGQEAMSGLLAIVNTSESEYNKLSEAVNNADGAAKDMAATMANNLQGQLTLMKSSAEGFGLAIYEKMQVPLTDLAKEGITAINSLTDGFREGGVEGMIAAAGEIVGKLLTGIAENAPRLIESGADLLISIIDGLVSEDNAEGLAEAALNIVETLSEKLIELAGVLGEAAFELVDALGNELSEKIPGLSVVFENLETVVISLTAAFVAYKAATAISEIIDTLRKATEGQTIAQTLLNAVMNANPFVLIATLIAGLVAAIVTLWNTNDGFRDALIGAWDAIKNAAVVVWESIVKFFTKDIPNAFNAVINFVKGNWQSLLLFITNPIAGALKLLYDLNPKFKEWVDNLLGKIKSWIGGIVDIGKNIVDGLKKGIQGAWNSLVSWFKGLFGDLIGIAKKILGIASPSKVFKKIGGFTAEGFGVGFEDEFAHVKDDMEDALNFDDASVGINASIRKVGAGAAGGAFGGTSIGNININIDGAKYTDEQSLASAIALEIQNMTDRRAAVYA